MRRKPKIIIKIDRRRKPSVTRREFAELKERLYKMYGIQKRIHSFKNKLERMEIDVAVLKSDNTMLKNILRRRALNGNSSKTI
jgi:16S rRNA C967 or C1407 C5-methylase (RsmB/RsmF family)